MTSLCSPIFIFIFILFFVVLQTANKYIITSFGRTFSLAYGKGTLREMFPKCELYQTADIPFASTNGNGQRRGLTAEVIFGTGRSSDRGDKAGKCHFERHISLSVRPC